jgi:hypothetical protein
MKLWVFLRPSVKAVAGILPRAEESQHRLQDKEGIWRKTNWLLQLMPAGLCRGGALDSERRVLPGKLDETVGAMVRLPT